MPEDLARAKDALEKSRFRSKEAFEQKFGSRIRRTSFTPGDLVLVRNSPNENTVSIDRKIKNRYMGPYRVIKETFGRAYQLEEMNGIRLEAKVAAFRLIPYVKRESLDGWARLIDALDGDQSEGTNEMDGESGNKGEELDMG